MNKTLLLTGASAFALMLAVSAPAHAIDGAKAEANGTSEDNFAIDDESQRGNLTDDAWNNGANGIVHNQQNNGNNNAVNAATAVHADVTGGTELGTGARATSTSDNNESEHTGAHDPDRGNRVLNTMNGFAGSATHQQNNGDNNAINSATALDGVSGNAAGVYQEATAEADTLDGETTDDFSDRSNLIESSFTGAAGVYTVQQNSASMV